MITTDIIPNANPNVFIADLITDPDELIFTQIIGWILETDNLIDNCGNIEINRFAYPITPEQVYSEGDYYVIMNRKYGEWSEPGANSGKGESTLLAYLQQRKYERESIAACHFNQKKLETK